jgi:hypothetical protein
MHEDLYRSALLSSVADCQVTGAVVLYRCYTVQSRDFVPTLIPALNLNSTVWLLDPAQQSPEPRLVPCSIVIAAVTNARHYDSFLREGNLITYQVNPYTAEVAEEIFQLVGANISAGDLATRYFEVTVLWLTYVITSLASATRWAALYSTYATRRACRWPGTPGERRCLEYVLGGRPALWVMDSWCLREQRVRCVPATTTKIRQTTKTTPQVSKSNLSQLWSLRSLSFAKKKTKGGYPREALGRIGLAHGETVNTRND